MELNPAIKHIPIPERMAVLPRQRGFPVPWFVAFIEGEADFRVVGPGKMELARKGLCWLCGNALDMTGSYVAGPMCAINRTSAEPPSHIGCASYAAIACPFLSRPHASRREVAMPEGLTKPPGIALMRNPGVALVWTTVSTLFPFDAAGSGTLYHLHDPLRVDWYCEGREALLEEVKASMQSGIPALREVAEQQEGGVEALYEAIKAVYKWMPRTPVEA